MLDSQISQNRQGRKYFNFKTMHSRVSVTGETTKSGIFENPDVNNSLLALCINNMDNIS